jgi:hypothetical protein
MRDAMPNPADELSAVQRSLEAISENLSYVGRELPQAGIGDALRADLEAFCERLMSQTGGMRVSTALIQELMAAGCGDAIEMVNQLEESVRRLIEELDRKVMAIRSISDENPESVAASLLCVLFHESGANILRACSEAVESLRRIAAASPKPH